MVSSTSSGWVGPPSRLQLKAVTPAGRSSCTETFVAVLGLLLLLVTTMVYVVVWPGTAVLALSVLVTPTSTRGVSVSVSVALLLPVSVSVTPEGGATVAVLLRDPVAVGLMARVSWKLVVLPVARVPVI